MKKLLNTLFVTKQNACLHRDGETVCVELDKQVLLRLPIHTLNGIATIGNVMSSPYLLNFCAERGVCASMFGEHGKFIARAEGPVSGNVLLRLAQMRAHEDKGSKGDLARGFNVGATMVVRELGRLGSPASMPEQGKFGGRGCLPPVFSIRFPSMEGLLFCGAISRWRSRG